jgi:hypothetical protein
MLDNFDFRYQITGDESFGNEWYVSALRLSSKSRSDRIEVHAYCSPGVAVT